MSVYRTVSVQLYTCTSVCALLYVGFQHACHATCVCVFIGVCLGVCVCVCLHTHTCVSPVTGQMVLDKTVTTFCIDYYSIEFNLYYNIIYPKVTNK